MPRWLDGTATIVNGRVLLTPAEADALYCLNLADGKPAWPAQPRVENRQNGEQLEHYYVACVHKGSVVLVGRNTIDAVKLEDGSKAWGGRSINLPAGVGVCGRGFYAGRQYFLPLSSGEVMSIDLESGKLAGSVKPRPGTSYSKSAAPGNLVCYRGRVISQGLDGLEMYYQADAARDEVARRLAANPDDIDGLTLRGEMFLDAGKPAEAVADFRRAYGLDKKSDSHGRTPRVATRRPAGRPARRFRRESLDGGRSRAALGRRGATGGLFPLTWRPVFIVPASGGRRSSTT